jgi:hypothetical protein
MFPEDGIFKYTYAWSNPALAFPIRIRTMLPIIYLMLWERGTYRAITSNFAMPTYGCIFKMIHRI